MGVHGLWKLLEPSGKPVPVETLENHVLAVDVSIWLHQLLQGYRDSGGNSLPNAHLLGLFHRVSKLLFFRIKPVFVFDGGVPTLKKKTISARHQQKDKATIASEKARQQLLKNLLKQKALSQVLGELKAVPSTSSLQAKKDLYELPPIVNEDDNSDLESVHDSYSSESEEDLKKNKKYKDLHGIDVHSTDFKALPADIRHDILTELKDKRKENSWGRIHEMPEDLGQFSNFQMNRLLKRRSVQVSLEEAEKEMGGRTFSLGDVETLLTEQGIQTSSDVGSRIASDNVTRYLYITDSTKVGKKASILNETKNDNSVPSEENKNESNNSEVTVDTIIDDEKVLVSEKESSKICYEEPLITTKQDLTDSISDEVKIEVSDSSSDEITFEEFNEEFELNRKLIAENSGLTQDQILSVIKEQNKTSNDSINKTVDVENSDFNVKDAIVKLENNKPHLDSSSSSEELDLLKIKGKSYSLPDINTENIQNNISNSYMTRVNSECEQREINNSDDIVVYCKKIDKKTGFYDDDDNNSTTFDRKEEKVVLETVSSNKISIPSTEEKDNGISDYSSNVEFIKVDQSLKNVNSKSKITSSVLQVTINTKENSVNNDEDIFADIFNDAVEEKINLGPQMSTNNENNGVELMNSSDTSVSEDEEDVVTTNNEVMPFIYESDSNSSPDKLITCKYFESSKKEDAVEKKINHENDLKDVNESRTVNFSEPTVNEKDESRVETLKATKKLSSKELNKLQTILVQQEQDLLQKQGKEERLASTVTEQMRIEAQELLQLFGVPWVMAPMEAEAQCAFLDRIGLTQGTITDDSDIWLFGARKVYKNFFNQKKFVLQFQAQDIQHYFKLSRGDLIELALLVGSDYTVGVTGVGPVTALEILAMFRPSSSNDSSVLNTLAAFKNWLQHPSNSNSPLANKLKEVRLEEGFPNKDVVEAYLHPLVDESEESFSWSLPDLDGLREFTKRKFGWSQARADELLLPVIKNLTQKTSQSKIDAFFQMKPAIPIYKDKVSQRVQKAIHRLGGESSSVLNQFESAPGTSSQRQRRSRGGSQNRKASGRGRGASLEIEPPPPPKPLPPPTGEELIPQRERDRLEAMKRKMQAIEVMKAKRNKKNQKRPSKAPIKQLANLSDSSSDDGN